MASVRSMTSGSPGKLIISFALPLMIGNLFQLQHSGNGKYGAAHAFRAGGVFDAYGFRVAFAKAYGAAGNLLCGNSGMAWSGFGFGLQLLLLRARDEKAGRETGKK